jgi:hypothetical protein
VKMLSITNLSIPVFSYHMHSNMMWLCPTGKQQSQHEADHSSPFVVRLEKSMELYLHGLHRVKFNVTLGHSLANISLKG